MVQTNTHTDGHSNPKTESAKWANSVKIAPISFFKHCTDIGTSWQLSILISKLHFLFILLKCINQLPMHAN